MLKRIIYIVKLYFRELLFISDYWHPKFSKRDNIFSSENKTKYFIDFTPKYPFPFKLIENIPIVEFNNKDVRFSITIFNYGLGLIDSIGHDNDTKKIDSLKSLINWALNNQDSDGFWRNHYSVPYMNIDSGWKSAMTQGLGISFLVRCHYLGLITKEKLDPVLTNACNSIFDEDIIDCVDGNVIFQEFEKVKTSVLNGSVFALYGLIDSDIYFERDINIKYIKYLSNILDKYDFFLWSKYSLDGTICSRFYHNLHIQLMLSLYDVTGDISFRNKARKWKYGMFLYPIFVTIKGFQKISNFATVQIHP